MTHRTEHDALGPVEVPSEAYYGSFTARAKKNFQLSGGAPHGAVHAELMQAYGAIKLAAARANGTLRVFDAKKAHAIEKAAAEFIDGKFAEEFTLDSFQAGAGTPYNMNCNEVIANRANEILGGKKGIYEFVHPNNHVNYGQSSNCVTPTAIRIAVLFLLPNLRSELERLSKDLRKKGAPYARLQKVGRTHLQDAVPMTVKQEFEAWATALERSTKSLEAAEKQLYEIHLGGTAVGTGITAHPKFHMEVIKELTKVTKLPLKTTKNAIELTGSMTVFTCVSAALRAAAIDLQKLANDLILLNSGPLAGLGELTLPEVEPGSSIMPGKVNPSVPEAALMVCYQIFGYDHAIALAAAGGQLQLNTFTPLIALNLLHGIKLLTNTAKMLTNDCVKGIIVNKNRIQELFDMSVCTATALSPYFGYQATAHFVKEAVKTKRPIAAIVEETGFITAGDLKKILSPANLTAPSIRDQKLYEKIQTNERYQAYLRKLASKKF